MPIKTQNNLPAKAILENETDAKGRKFMIHKLPIPEKPVCIQEQDLKGLMFEPGEDTREAGERLAASYVNFYIANEGISLLENVANIGIPIPNKIRNALEQLNKDDEEGE